MSNDVVIIGAGQQCHVVLYNLREQGIYNPVCILDPNPAVWGKKIEGVYVEPDYSDFDLNFLNMIRKKYLTNIFFLGIGAMKLRKGIFNFFRNNGWDSINIVHPNAVVSKTATLGTGILIEAGCLVTPNPQIGDNVVINTGSQVNHDNIVFSNVYIASGVVLSGGVTIGDNTLIDDGVIITLGRKVGEECIIGAGSVVTKDIPEGSIAYGVPCKIVKKNNKYE